MPIDRSSPKKPSVTFNELIAASVAREKGTPVAPEIALQLEQATAALNGVIKTFNERISEALDLPSMRALRDGVPNLVALLATMTAARDAWPANIQQAMLALGKIGWYLDKELPAEDAWRLGELASNGNASSVNLMLEQYFEERLDDIEREICKVVPMREKIIAAAFNAHRRAEYELSVPVLLAQSDGVCLDMTGSHYFLKDKKLPAPAKFVEKLQGDFYKAWCTPLAVVLPIAASAKQRQLASAELDDPSWIELNRHTVLHGESVDYGTRLNSLKAISLLNYLATFVPSTEQPS